MAARSKAVANGPIYGFGTQTYTLAAPTNPTGPTDYYFIMRFSDGSTARWCNDDVAYIELVNATP